MISSRVIGVWALIIFVVGLFMLIGGYGGKITIQLPGLGIVGHIGAVLLVIGALDLLGWI